MNLVFFYVDSLLLSLDLSIKNMTFPNTTGYFYPKNSKRVILFEMHYDNLPDANGITNGLKYERYN
jgi:hypothetical protein